MLNAVQIAERLTERFGVAMTGDAYDDADGQRVRIRPAGLERTRGFTVGVLISWRTIETDFVADSYASQLLNAMAAAPPNRRAAFGAFIRSSLTDGATVTFRVNDQNIEPFEPSSWPSDWKSLTLSMRKGPFQIDGTDPAGLEGLAIRWTGRMLGSVLSLLELERIAPAGETEGAAYRQLVTKYERSEVNRAACVEIHGCFCKVCGLDFEKTYGALGRGFIEVHHLELVSRLAPDTVVDPAHDLVPLCSNCHSMAHRRQPPFTLDELRTAMQSARGRAAS